MLDIQIIYTVESDDTMKDREQNLQEEENGKSYIPKGIELREKQNLGNIILKKIKNLEN